MMQQTAAERRRRLRISEWLWDEERAGAEYVRGDRAAATIYMAVLTVVAITFIGVEVVHPVASSAGLTNAVLEIGITLAVLLGAWILHRTFRQEAHIRRSVADATARERQRIARDLHDGLTQDLAFIAAHGDRLAVEMGAEHPLAVAARRALAVSRGAIAELSAPHAATAGEALHQIADELSTRFEIDVEVRAEPLADRAVMASDREDIVRIAREAIVNAAQHGRAQKVAVLLALEGNELALSVSDNGVGIAAAPAPNGGGFGLGSMRERAMELGGRLSTQAPASGGTELKLVVPS